MTLTLSAPGMTRTIKRVHPAVAAATLRKTQMLAAHGVAPSHHNKSGSAVPKRG